MLTFWKYDLEFIYPHLPTGPGDPRNPTTPSPEVQARITVCFGFGIEAEGVALSPKFTMETKSACTTAIDACMG